VRRYNKVIMNPVVMPGWTFAWVVVFVVQNMFTRAGTTPNDVLGWVLFLIVAAAIYGWAWRLVNKTPVHYVVMHALSVEQAPKMLPTWDAKYIDLNDIPDGQTTEFTVR